MTQPELVLDDVYGIWFTPFLQTPLGYAILILSILLGMLAAYACFRFFRNRARTPKERALRALKSLEMQVKKGSVDPRKMYQSLTDIIKEYARWRYEMPRGMTDYELTVLLENTDSKTALYKDIMRILIDAQTIKFGKREALKATVQNDITNVISFIEATASHT